MPYRNGLMRRLIVQLLLTTFVGLFIISALTELTSWIAKGRPAPLDFYTVDLIIISIWFFVINGIYVGLHFYREWQRLNTAVEEQNRMTAKGFWVKHGKQDIRLDFGEISGFFIEGEYAAVCHSEGKKYYSDLSLDKIEQSLPPEFFFRLNRQYILHRNLMNGFKRIDGGKLLVSVKEQNNFPPEITVSRIKAPTFKGWFRPEA